MMMNTTKKIEDIGDGKAVFMGDMTEDEYEEYEKSEINGWKKIYEQINKLI